MTYQPNIPTGDIDLDQDYLNVQTNFQQLDTQYGVDHVPYSNADGTITGFHKSIHLNPVSTTATNPPNNQPVVTPVATAGVGQLFSAQINDGINPDEALYFLTGGNRLSQLTRNFQPISDGTGQTTYLPGGFILKFGAVSPVADLATGTVTFNNINSIPFPNACYGVWTQPFYTGSAPNGGAEVAVKVNTNVSFNWEFFTDSGSYNGFYWCALGI